MTTTALTSSARWTALRSARLLALVSGVALLTDTVTIAVINSTFDPLDSILFLTGFVCLFATGIALAVHLSVGRQGLMRVVVGVAVFGAFTLALGGISAGFDQLGRHIFSASNKGLHDEWSFFSIGVCLVLLGWWLRTRDRRLQAHLA